MTLKKTWLAIAGAALMPVAAFGAIGVETTIVQNGAPIAIDRCDVVLTNGSAVSANGSLSEDLGFTNVSQRTATQVRFGFEIVDANGVTERTVTGEKLGTFIPGSAIDDAGAAPNSRQIEQTVSALPRGIKALCRVEMVRFDYGSIWHEGDGPAGTAAMYTPLPGPIPTPQWQWPYDPPTP